jgi:hypothetical protein
MPPPEVGEHQLGRRPKWSAPDYERQDQSSTARVLPLFPRVRIALETRWKLAGTTPEENRSVRASSSLARTCSGDM